MKAIIIGGSMAGLFAGNMLHRRGWEVEVFERVGDDLASRGAGIAQHVEMAALLQQAGVTSGCTSGLQVSGRSAYDATGRVIAWHEFPQKLSAWGAVYSALLSAFPVAHYHSGAGLAGIEHSRDGVAAILADGSVHEADLLIGADGFRSKVRAIEAASVAPAYAGYVAWRGQVEEGQLSQNFLSEVFDKYAFCFTPGGQLIGYPVATEAGAERRYNFLWYTHVPAGGKLDALLTDPNGNLHEYSISPSLIRPAHVEQLRQDAAAKLPPHFAEAVIRSERHMLQPIYDVDSDRIAFNRVALAGDAAFVARPHVGIGVLKAGQDAWALTECLDMEPSVPAALSAYEARRAPAGQEAVRLGRWLGAFIERGLDGPEADPALELSPAKIIRISARPVEQLRAEALRWPAAFARRTVPARVLAEARL